MKINDLFYEKILDDMKNINNLYKISNFWSRGFELISDKLMNGNIKIFRKLKDTRKFFVPTYSIEGLNYFPEDFVREFESKIQSEHKKDQTLLESLKTGRHLAYADYRTFKAGDIDGFPYLDSCSESFIGNPIEQFTFDDKKFSRSMLNYINGLVFLKRNIDTSEIFNVLEIGGGFGTLGEILKNDPKRNYKYVNIDIPPTIYASSYYLSELYKEKFKSCYDLEKENGKIILENNNFESTVLCPWQLPHLEGNFDLFVNFISFQEMEPDIVINYINHISRLKCKFVLLRNIREGKNTKKNKDINTCVIEPITTDFYIKEFTKKGYKLVNTNIIPYGFMTVDGFNSELILLRLK